MRVNAVRLACAALVAFATSLLFTGSAIAGSFQITQCMPPTGSHAFALLNAAQFSTLVECPPATGVVFSGILAQDTLGAGGYANGARGGYLISAAPGTTITSIAGRRYFGTRGEHWSVGARAADGQVLETCVLDPQTQIICERGHPTTPTHPDNDFAYTGLNTASIAFDFVCAAPGASTCPRTPSQHEVWVVLYGATLAIDDPAPPSLGSISGSLLGPGGMAGWHRGVESATVQASDASGVKQVRLVVDGQTRVSATKICEYTQPRPCPASVGETLTLDLAGVGQGTYALQFGATDAAGQETLSTTSVLKVDHVAPTRPEGLAAARNADGSWGLTWTNPPQGTAAPIVTAHYLVCQPGSSADCPSGEAKIGADIQRLDAPLPPGGGPWDILVWLQDEAGNVDPSTAARVSVNTSLAIAPPPPPPPSSSPAPPPAPPLNPTPKRAAGMRVTASRRLGAILRVNGSIRPAATGLLSLSIRATRDGPVLARGRARANRGRWQFRLSLPRRVRTTGRALITIRYPGDGLHRSQTIARRLVGSRIRAVRSTIGTEFGLEPG